MMQGERLSLLLGYTSIACWLGAQFPQIVVNWRRKSVDGLALPFLANWLLGDTTNLIGCLLTDQLPFQTYLAAYFVFVDICLVSQFLHYDVPRHAKTLSVLTSSTARQSRASLISHSPESHTLPRSRISRSRSRSYSVDPHLRAAVANLAHVTSELEPRYPDMGASDLDIHGSQSRRRMHGSQLANSLEGLPESVVAEPRDNDWGGRRVLSHEHEAKDEATDAESDSVMIDSFYSEEGGRNRGSVKHVSWTRESPGRDGGSRRLSLEPPPEEPESSSAVHATIRGRQLTRISLDSPTPPEPPITQDNAPSRPRRPSEASAVSVAASRRSASIVFLGVFALLTFSSHAVFQRSGGSDGDVLSGPPSSAMPVLGNGMSTSRIAPRDRLSFGFSPNTIPSVDDFQIHVPTDADTQRLIGRVSAWTCTTLYITSRLPQIWKNFARKSVEGLSMYLFVFAFLGNFFYVLSILTSPKMNLPPSQAKQFIRDSVPYLLGSGGTLLFDVTIVLQSFVYAPGRRRSRARARRRSLVAASGEEERRLLATDPHEDTDR